MLNRLFAGSGRPSDADLRSHLLLHGENGDHTGTLEEHDLRIIIAQDLGDKAKVVLLDTQKTTTQARGATLDPSSRTSSSLAGNGGKKRPSFPLPKETSSTPELLTELMFGTVPLSYRGTSVRVHPLSSNDATESRSFLFTKVFTVNVSGYHGLDSPHDDSSVGSLSSSYSSSSGFRSEYPFPMTTIKDPEAGTAATPRERKSRERGAPHTVRALDKSFQRQPQSTLPKHHQRAASGGNRSDLGDIAPYVPFTKVDANQSHDDYFSGWLPSPGPVLARRRRSTGTNDSTSPGSLLGRSRYQAAMCAIGVVFTVPGTGHEHTECAMLTRYWQMLTRAIYALQRVVYDEVELALNFVTANGALQTPCSRTHIRQKDEAQVYQRGKKLYVALGQNCLRTNNSVSRAVDSFRARLAGGINLPEIHRRSLQQEASILMEELSLLIAQLDRKETKFIFFTLLTYLADHLKNMRVDRTDCSSFHRNILRNRIVIVSDNAVLARRLIFCIARIFFRRHNEHLRDATDYSLVWPSSGLLHVSRKELLRKRRFNQASSARLTRGWDIPGLSRPLSSNSYNMPPISPSMYHRPPSTASNASSRASSWKPSWSWFMNNSRTNLHQDDSSRSDTRTVQTSWTSADFAEMTNSSVKHRSPRSCSPHDALKQDSPSPDSDGAITDHDEEDEEDSVDTAVPISQLKVQKNADGTVDVAFLHTVSMISDADPAEPIKIDQSEPEYPLTGLLSRFHPDMLLQAIPQAAYSEGEFKDYLIEEDLYIPQIMDLGAEWMSGASVTIAELGSSWRLRKLTRLARSVGVPSTLLTEDADAAAQDRSPFASTPLIEESWSDEVIVDLDETLRQTVLQAIKTFKLTNDTTHVQKMIDILFDDPTH